MRAPKGPGLLSLTAALDPALRLPSAAPGRRIGLFGGSFNPPHRGHRHLALTALRRLGLDEVWWLVTPGNPMKKNDGLPPLARRVALARRLADHPAMRVSGFEAAIGTRYSADLVRFLTRRRPGVRFVWLMGADNLASLHRWQKWREIVERVPFAVIDRPGAGFAALNAPAAQAYEWARLPETDARALADAKPPAWVFLHVPLEPSSSTALRSCGTTSTVMS